LVQAQAGVRESARASSAGGTTVTWSDGYRVVQHPLPNGSAAPWGISVDPGGVVWFVEQGTNQLGEYSPSTGNFTQYLLPTPRSEPIAVASDSSGNIWVTELRGERLGELVRGGSSVVEHALPNASENLAGKATPLSCGPTAILPDPSGSIWVACLFSNQIDRFYPVNDSFSVFDLPVFQSAPAGLAFDGRGNLWFTAADAEMLGKGDVSQMRNGTDDGITEFAPVNATYVFSFPHQNSFLGSPTTLKSSLPTPSGIVFAPGGETLWVTEHVDTSFDSYNVGTGTLDRYWTSQTYGAYGFIVSFPNGIVMGNDGTVWVGEHYGNKLAEFDPKTGQMVEYGVPCCPRTIAGVYSVALDPSGDVWFVEIQGGAIGELVPVANPDHLTLTLPSTRFSLGSDGSLALPMSFTLSKGAAPQRLSFNVSGISSTGALQGATALFSPSELSLSPGQTANLTMDLSLGGLAPGKYYLTLTATAATGGVQYSMVISLAVTAAPPLPLAYLAAAVAGLSAAAVVVAWRLTKRPSRRRALKKFSRPTRASGPGGARPPMPPTRCTPGQGRIRAPGCPPP
jgi:streptogramin lyase